MTSPKTTTLGILGITTLLANVALQLIDGDPLTNPDWGIVMPAVLAALTGLFARDDK
jgi:hypothetical protein